jgi:DNA-binding NarL/FixJ family response regulator
MNEAMIIDPTATNRATLIHQLGVIEPYTVLQFNQYANAEASLSSSPLFGGIIFVTLAEGFDRLSEFTKKIRVSNRDACLIAVLGNVTADEMKSLVQIGIDQILLRPFTANQLKEKIRVAQAFRKQIQSEALMKPSSSHFETRVDELAEKFYKINLNGWLAENCILPEIKPPVRDCTLFLDCDHLRGVNSIGIRLWMLWLKGLMTNGFIRFEIENFRPSLLQQASFVKGFIPENGAVNSFYLYYWNEELDEEKEFKISRGKEYATNQMRIPSTKEAVKDGVKVVYQIDPSAQRYLRFFQGTITIV